VFLRHPILELELGVAAEGILCTCAENVFSARVGWPSDGRDAPPNEPQEMSRRNTCCRGSREKFLCGRVLPR